MYQNGYWMKESMYQVVPIAAIEIIGTFPIRILFIILRQAQYDNENLAPFPLPYS